MDKEVAVAEPGTAVRPDRCDSEVRESPLSAGEAAVEEAELFAAAVRMLNAGEGTAPDRIEACGDCGGGSKRDAPFRL